MTKKGRFRRLISLLLTVAMVCALMPATAFAAEPSQITKQGEVVTKTVEKEGMNASVTINKNITQVEENVFEIKLSATTTEDIKSVITTPDAAVVVIMDASGSMNKKNKARDAQRAAAGYTEGGIYHEGFLDLFAKDAGSADRLVSVVEFGTSASTLVPWTNVSHADKMENAKAKIHALTDMPKDNEMTSIESALKLASNLMAQVPKNSNGKDILNKYVILLTDGSPTAGIINRDRNSTSTTKIGGSDYYYGKGSEDDIATYANAIKVTCGATLYSIAFDLGDNGKKVLNKLSTDGDKGVFSADNMDQLFKAFKDIADLIALSAKAWIVEDPMGENIVFDIEENTKNGYEIDPSGDVVKGFTTANNRLRWVVKADQFTKVDNSYLFETTYRVKLNNAGNDFDFAKTDYATNGATTLTYAFIKNDVVQDEGILNFDVPEVKAFKGDFTFQKVSAVEKTKGLAGAEFTLTSKENKPGSTEKIVLNATSADGGMVTFNNIPSGYTYILAETKAPQDYKLSEVKPEVKVAYGVVTVDKKSATDYKFENELIQKVTTVPVQKTWKKNGSTNAPAVEITLVAKDGNNEIYNETGKVTTPIGSSTSNVYEFKNVPTGQSAKTGNEIVLSVSEAPVEGFTLVENYPQIALINVNGTDISGFLFENRQDNPKTASLVVEKSWLDTGSNVRPESVTVVLVKDGVKTDQSLELTATNGWKGEFTGLDKYTADLKKEVEYSIYEITSDKHTVTSVDNAFSSYNTTVANNTAEITNILKQEKIKIDGEKTWNDDENSKRPDSIIVRLMKGNEQVGFRTVTPNTDGKWSYSFEDVDKYTFTTDDNGKVTEVTANVYTVVEDAVSGYEATIGSATNSYGIVNTAVGKTDVVVNKQWVDVSGTSHDSVTVELFADGSKIGTDGLTATFEKSHTFTGLDKFDSNGKLINYTVTEEVPAGYTAAYAVDTTTDTPIITVTNTISDPNDITVGIQKIWQAPADAEKPSVTMQLTRSLDGGTTWENVEGQTLSLDGTTTSGTFKNLPKFEYVAVEAPVVPDVPPVTPDAPVTPDVPPVTPDVPPVTPDVPPVTPDVPPVAPDVPPTDPATPTESTTEATGNADAVLAAADAVATEAIEIKYNVVETSKPAGYSVGEAVESSAGSNNFTITNTIFETVSISGTKTWVTPQGENVPEITINLMSNNPNDPTHAPEVIQTRTLSSGTTTFNFDNLPRYTTEGKEISYSLAEETVSGYSPKSGLGEVTFENGKANVTIVNEKNMTYTRITGNKHWIDPSDIEHGAVEIALFQDGKPVATVSVAPQSGATTQDVLSYEITNPDNVDGWPDYYLENGVLVPHVYTVVENNVPEGYEMETSEEGFEVYNILKQNSNYAVSGTKVWMDPVGTEHPNITIQLQVLVNGVPVDVEGKTVTLTNGETEYTFEGLNEFDEVTKERLSYVVKEITEVAGYTSQLEGMDVHNIIADDSFDVNVSKAWANVGEGVELPESIEVALFEKTVDDSGIAGEVKYGDTLILSASTGWNGKFEQLPMYNKEKQYVVYELRELTDVPNCEEAAPVMITGKDAQSALGASKVVETTLTNTMLDYQYRINTYYTTITNGVAGGTVQIDRGIVRGEENQVITVADVDRNAWMTGADNNLYGYVTNANTVESVTLLEQGVIYDINLYYERSVVTTGPVGPPSIPSTPVPPTVDIETPEVPLVDTPEVEIPEGETPLAEAPVVADGITIEDGEVPLAEAPFTVEIPEEPVPLSDVPPTGDENKVGVYGAFLAAAAGALLLLFKKRETEEK